MALWLSLRALVAPLWRSALAWALALAVVCASSVALAFDPPPLAGHVVDTSGKLPEVDRVQLGGKLSRYRQQSGHEVAVLVVETLNEESIEDVAYATFNAWKVGQKNKDDGVLLVIALAERRSRIETGKGVGGDLTDLQTNEILRERVAPRLQQGDLRGAIDAGTDGVIGALGGGTATGKQAPPRGKKTLAARRSQPSTTQLCLGLLLVILLLWLISRLSRGGGGFFFFLPGGGWGGGGGGGDDDDDRYTGGGGESGGGGSSDSW